MFEALRYALTAGLLVALTSPLVGIPEYETSIIEPDEVVDFIVVGSGTAGSVVASRLSEVPQWDVLVLEAGGQPPPMSKIPALNWYGHATGSKYLHNHPIVVQKYAMRSFNKEGQFSARGKMIGGSSAINAMIYLRGNRRDFDGWAAMGNPGWDYDSVLPFFRKIEDYKGKHAGKFARFHGKGGPLSVESFRWENPLKKYYAAAAEELGLRETDFNSDQPIGYSSTDMSMKNGERHSASDAYLKPNLQRPNLRIQINSQVLKILIDGNRRAIGVQYTRDGKVRRVFAKKEVILSAGAIDSPAVLMLSGIGPRAHLQSHGIDTVVDLAGVGQGLQDHLVVIGLTWLTDPGQTLPEVEALTSVPGMLRHSWKAYRDNRTGPLSVPLELIGHILTNVGEDADPTSPDTELSFTSRVLGADGGRIVGPGIGVKREVIDGYLKGQEGRIGFQCEIYATRPKSLGSVTLQSSSPFDPVIVDPNYNSHPGDVEAFVKSLKYCLRFGNTSAIKHRLGATFYDKPLPGCDHLAYASDDYWRCYAQSMTATACHYSGTCKMAPDSDPLGVVSPRLKVRGIKGLRVIDASIMPAITSYNLNAPTFMIAEKGAAMVKEDWGVFD